MGPPNGKSFEIAVFDTCRFQDGKIVGALGITRSFCTAGATGAAASTARRRPITALRIGVR